MKLAYIDCSSGISGDMLLGAFVDLGLSIEALKNELTKLNLTGYCIDHKKVIRGGIAATKVDVIVKDKKIARKWADIKRIIDSSHFSEKIKEKGLTIFRRLFDVESLVHGKEFEKTYLHELGAIDCLVDIFGVLVGFQKLAVDEIYFSAVNLGSGKIKSHHGFLPVPAPATIELLKGIPVYSDDTPFELTTPTGASFVSALFKENGPIPEINIESIGYGAGSKEIRGKPNVLRVLLGRSLNSFYHSDKVSVIETNIDDMDPRLYEHTMENLLKAGALDVFLTPIIMKKSRPAVTLTAIVDHIHIRKIIEIILTETTTFGLRIYEVNRKVLEREIIDVDSPYGTIKVKVGKTGKTILKATPEYENLKAVAKKKNIPIAKLLSEISSKFNG